MPDELAEQMGRRIVAGASESDTRGGARERTSAVDDAGEVVGRRIVSRLVEMCGDPLPLYGEDRRREFRATGAGGVRP